MCIALPRGGSQGPPPGLLRQVSQWLHFGLLLLAFTSLGLVQWAAAGMRAFRLRPR